MVEPYPRSNSQSQTQNFKFPGRIECNLVLFFTFVSSKFLLFDASTGYKVKHRKIWVKNKQRGNESIRQTSFTPKASLCTLIISWTFSASLSLSRSLSFAAWLLNYTTLDCTFFQVFSIFLLKPVSSARDVLRLPALRLHIKHFSKLIISEGLLQRKRNSPRQFNNHTVVSINSFTYSSVCFFKNHT